MDLIIRKELGMKKGDQSVSEYRREMMAVFCQMRAGAQNIGQRAWRSSFFTASATTFSPLCLEMAWAKA